MSKTSTHTTFRITKYKEEGVPQEKRGNLDQGAIVEKILTWLPSSGNS